MRSKSKKPERRRVKSNVVACDRKSETEKMEKNLCSNQMNEQSTSGMTDYDCAGFDNRTRTETDELLRDLEEIRRQSLRDQEELRRLRAEAERERGPSTSCSPDHGLTEIFRSLAVSLESAVSSRQMRFEDVEKSFKTYHGNGNMSIVAWINHFNNQADLFQLNSFQRFAYAKRLMRDGARLFVDHESKAVTWIDLQYELKKEFGKRVNSAEIHRRLRERKKRKEETTTQYLYEMMALAAQAEVDEAAVVAYVSDGLPGSMELKAFMYEAESIERFKLKLKSYDMLQARQQDPKVPRQKESRQLKPKFSKPRFQTEERKMTCFVCGDSTHKIADCPHKDKGPKCFGCGEYGHFIRQCTSKTSAGTRKINCIRRADSRTRKWVTINNLHLYALVDTGSDYTVVREDKVTKANCVLETLKQENRVKGVGGYTRLRSRFPANVEIDGNSFHTDCYVLSKEDIDEEAIIGLDIILKCKMELSPDGLFLKKLVDGDEKQDLFAEFCNINHVTIEEQQGVDLSNIHDKSIRKEVESMVCGYAPRNENNCPIEMDIILKDETPIYTKPRRASPKERKEIEAQVEQWLEDGVIRPSYSDFAAQVLFAPKKDGTKRLCVDFRPLNEKIVKDRFPIPNLEEQLDQLCNGRVFSKLDLKNGYFHVPINEKSKKYTSFVTHTGQYEFNRVPFGLSTSPAVFCRFINLIFRHLIAKGIVFTYMDDVIIVAKDEREAVDRLKIVMELAASFNLQIKWKKCELLKRNIEFLGQEIQDGTVRSIESKVKGVNRYPEPKNIKQLQKFLGFANYFRKFIENFAVIAKPLYDLQKKDAEFVFGEAQREAFEVLKSKIVERPVLALYQPDAETELHTDASKWATAAILMQKSKEDNEFHPVVFLSTKTTPAQEKWFSYELELYAVYLAVTKLRNYLLDIKFTVVTDCQALKTARQKKDVRKVAAWLMELQSFDFTIAHRPGSKMQHVDALSRINLIQNSGLSHQIRRAQEEDEHIITIKEILKEKPYDDYVLHNGLLCRYANSSYQIVVPKRMEMSVIVRAHQQGHFKKQKLITLISKEFFIEDLGQKVTNVVENCIECILCDRKEGKKEGFLHPIDKEPLPLNTFHVDHLGPMPSTNKNYIHIMTVVDAFTKFVWLFPTKSTTAVETLEKMRLITNIFGNPSRIIADRGAAFKSNIFQEFCKEEGIELVLCTTGVPRGNGQVERIHRIVISALSKLSIENPEQWYKHVYDVQKILNSTFQRAIRMTPFKLMFGVEMKKKDSDLMKVIEEEMLEEFNSEREKIREMAKESISKITKENRATYNRKRKEARKYEVDDLVAINKTQFSQASKLKPKFLGPYKVTAVKGNERYEMEKVGLHDGPNRTSSSADNMKRWTSLDDLYQYGSINMIRSCSKSNKSATVFVEGNIGAGKTTLLNLLAEYDFVKVHEEPIKKWQDVNGFNLLKMSYEDPDEYAFLFQSYVLLTMLQRHTEEFETSKVNVMERSIQSGSNCFMKMLIENERVKQPFSEVYQQWFDFVQGNFKIEPNLIIYLKTSPENLLNRIRQREREEEQNLSLHHLQQLHEMHENWIEIMREKCEILTVNADLKLDAEVLQQILHRINNML